MSGLEILETNNYFNFNTNDPKREGGSNSQGIYQGGGGGQDGYPYQSCIMKPRLQTV